MFGVGPHATRNITPVSSLKFESCHKKTRKISGHSGGRAGTEPALPLTIHLFSRLMICVIHPQVSHPCEYPHIRDFYR